MTLFEAIGTGFDNIFSYRKVSEERKIRIQELVHSFDPSEEYFTQKVLHKMLFVEAPPSLQALTLIMRALVKKPKLLILDEPFAGMNDALIQKCRHFLDTQLQEDQTLVFISHYPEEWPATLGKRLHLEDGQATESVLE